MKRSEAIQLLKPYHIWVLAPRLESEDPHLQYYYDFTQSIREYTAVFEALEADWTWQSVCLSDHREQVRSLSARSNGKMPLVLNLCDGDEVNGAPGISVIRALVRAGLIHTGADAAFYALTTSKVPMKKAFDKEGVPHAPWRVVTDKPGSLRGLCQRVGTPLILKPAVSGGSMGVSVKNVVHNDADLLARVAEIRDGYRGWNLLADGLIAERFITGPEFTTFITGSAHTPDHCRVYEPVERVFHPSLPETEKFLSFDRLWEIYEEEAPMPGNGNFYEYRPADPALVPALKAVSLAAYKACGGTGYTRIDIRQDQETGQLFLLEVNAQCGLSEDENYTSIGAILKASGVGFTDVVVEILRDALRRSVQPATGSVRRSPAPSRSKKLPARARK